VVNGTVSFANGTNTYSVTSAPTNGTVEVNSATGAFTYIPTDAAQLTAVPTDQFIETATNTSGSSANDTITVPITPAQLAVTNTISVGFGPDAVAVSPNGNFAYVANLEGSDGSTGTVSVINANPTSSGYGTVVNTINVGQGPIGVAVSNNGADVYVTNENDGTVSVINTANPNTVTDTIDVVGSPGLVVFSPDGSLAYVTESTDPTLGGGTNVYVIDTATNEVIDTVPVGNSPLGVAVAPNGTAYVTNVGGDATDPGQGTVSVISLVPTS
jgi:YVTN family beta-propeller protein